VGDSDVEKMKIPLKQWVLVIFDLFDLNCSLDSKP
jgi:hypothetical protein